MIRFLGLSLVAMLVAAAPARADDDEPRAPDETPTANPAQSRDDPASADMTLTDPSRARELQVALLDDILAQNSKKTRRERRAIGWSGLVGGLVSIGLGAWRLTGENDDGNEFWRGVGVGFITIGAANISVSAVTLSRIAQEEERFERWRGADKSTLTDRELGQFEGEMRASAYIRKGERRLIGWTGLAQAVAGVLVLSLTPIPDLDRKSRRSGYIIGGIYVGFGMLAFGLSIRKTPTEKAWERYERVQGLKVSPQVGRGYGGAAVSGRF